MVGVCVPGLLHVVSFQEVVNEAATVGSSVSDTILCIGCKVRREWKRLKGVEVVERTRALAKVDAGFDACLHVSACEADSFGNAFSIGDLAGDGS